MIPHIEWSIRVDTVAFATILIGLFYKFNKDWQDNVAKVNELWMQYCIKNNKPFSTVGGKEFRIVSQNEKSRSATNAGQT